MRVFGIAVQSDDFTEESKKPHDQYTWMADDLSEESKEHHDRYTWISSERCHFGGPMFECQRRPYMFKHVDSKILAVFERVGVSEDQRAPVAQIISLIRNANMDINYIFYGKYLGENRKHPYGKALVHYALQ